MKENIPGLSPLTSAVNKLFHGKEPWQVSAITAVTVLTGFWLWDIFESGSICERVKKQIFYLIKKIPKVSKKIEGERQKVYELFKKEVISRSEGLTYVVTLPEKAKNPDEILNLVKIHLAAGKYAWKDGYVSGSVYYHDETLMNLVGEVNKLSVYTNPLHPDVFPGVCKMEAEVIKIIANLFHGGAEACGAMTSGGTESIMMACKAYRDYGLHERGIKNPEMIIPVTAHAAFEKAGSYLKIRVKHIAVDNDSTCVNIRAMERAISKNTIMLVGSTPNFPYGTMDDIEQISRLGNKYGIPVHVDCCLGSFVAAFKRDLGYEVPPFDFSLPGVTSMSVDTHKYGFAPKGSSVVLYSELKYRHHQYFASLSWPGGLYGSPSVSGSRSGAIIASCWATLMYFGADGYRNTVKKILSVAEYIEDELRTVDGIFIFGKPFSTVIALGSKKFHIYRLSQALNEKSWNLNMLQFPFGIHICLTQLHTLPGVADRFINDVKEEVKKIVASPNDDLEGKVAMYGMSSALPDRSIVGDFTKSYLDAIYYTPKKDA